MYSNSCCSCSFKPKIIKIGQSSHKMYSNKILNFRESTTILNTCTQSSVNFLPDFGPSSGEDLLQKWCNFCESVFIVGVCREESTLDIYNYGKYINQCLPNTIKVIPQYERINKKVCRQKMSIMFNEIAINEEMLPKYTHTHTYIYIYMCVCVCVYMCVCVCVFALVWFGLVWFYGISTIVGYLI